MGLPEAESSKPRLFAAAITPAIGSIREELFEEPLRTIVATHEAGHVVVGSLLLRQLPVAARSRTSITNAGGVVVLAIDLAMSHWTILGIN